MDWVTAELHFDRNIELFLQALYFSMFVLTLMYKLEHYTEETQGLLEMLNLSCEFAYSSLKMHFLGIFFSSISCMEEFLLPHKSTSGFKITFIFFLFNKKLINRFSYALHKGVRY